MAVAVMERDRISELAETDEILALREKCKKEAELIYGNGDIDVLADALSILAERGIYRTDSLGVYIDIQETMNLLREKYVDITDHEMKAYVEATFVEANEALEIIWNNL